MDTATTLIVARQGRHTSADEVGAAEARPEELGPVLIAIEMRACRDPARRPNLGTTAGHLHRRKGLASLDALNCMDKRRETMQAPTAPTKAFHLCCADIHPRWIHGVDIFRGMDICATSRRFTLLA